MHLWLHLLRLRMLLLPVVLCCLLLLLLLLWLRRLGQGGSG